MSARRRDVRLSLSHVEGIVLLHVGCRVAFPDVVDVSAGGRAATPTQCQRCRGEGQTREVAEANRETIPSKQKSVFQPKCSPLARRKYGRDASRPMPVLMPGRPPKQ